MIVIVGDLHGNFELVNQLIKEEPKVDIILQCGDFGYWPKLHNMEYRDVVGNKKRFNQYALKNGDVKIYFCDGNHEDHSVLSKVNNSIMPIMHNVFYMKRGSYLTLPDGRNVLFMGGAYSIDRNHRIIGDSWFPEELISLKDIYNLPDMDIDIVISHTAPMEFDIGNDYHKDPCRHALSVVLEKYGPKLWYFGHFHEFKTGTSMGCKWTCLNSAEETKNGKKIDLDNPWMVTL